MIDVARNGQNVEIEVTMLDPNRDGFAPKRPDAVENGNWIRANRE